MKRPIMILEHAHPESSGYCWQLGLGGRRYNYAAHISLGRPVWPRPTAGVLRYRGITEWRAGWLLVALQVARKRRPW